VLATLAENSKYPGVPSIAQLGYPELADPLTMTYLIIGPPNLPKEITDILIPAFKKVFNDKEFLNQAKKIDFEPDPLYGEDAERLSKKLFKYYDEKMPIVRRYLM